MKQHIKIICVLLVIPLASLAMTVMQSPDGGTPPLTSPEYNTITFDYDSCGNLVWRQGKYIVVVDPGLEPPGGGVLFQGGIDGRSIGVTSGPSGGAYAASVLTTHYKDWRWRDFLKAVGIGAVSAALTTGVGQGCMALGISTNTMNTFAYKMLSQTTNAIVTDVLFGNKMSASDLIASGVGAIVGCQMPDFKAREGGALGNFLGETLHNTVIGGVTGMAQGIVKSVLEGNDKYIWQGIAGGAISGISRTVAHNLIAGSPYVFHGKSNGVFRKGGLVGWIMKGMEKHNEDGLTLGRHAFVVNGNLLTSVHEDYHMYQIEDMGWGHFYYRILGEYLKFGFNESYGKEGTLEYSASMEEKKIRDIIIKMILHAY